MIPQIEKVEKLLGELQASVKELGKEIPNINCIFFNFDIFDLVPRDYSKKLQDALNAARLRKIALNKLTPEDKEILGIK